MYAWLSRNLALIGERSLDSQLSITPAAAAVSVGNQSHCTHSCLTILPIEIGGRLGHRSWSLAVVTTGRRDQRTVVPMTMGHWRHERPYVTLQPMRLEDRQQKHLNDGSLVMRPIISLGVCLLVCLCLTGSVCVFDWICLSGSAWLSVRLFVCMSVWLVTTFVHGIFTAEYCDSCSPKTQTLEGCIAAVLNLWVATPAGSP